VVELQRFEQWKGVGFVAATGLFFFLAAWLVLRRLAAQQRLLERQRAVLAAADGPVLAGTFSAAVAHDLNNALTVARAGLETLEAPDAPPERRTRALALLRRALDELARIASRMVRLGAAEGAPHPEALDLAALVRETVAFGRRHPKLRACALEVDVPSPLPFVADRMLLQRALLNLMLNAADATGGRGPLEVRLAADEDEMVLEVHDGGPGVEPERREDIFVAFHTTKPDGTGLGLFSVRSAAEALGGEVGVEDSPLGGACFRITLPARG
jgi:signal transduction histidine kinase